MVIFLLLLFPPGWCSSFRPASLDHFGTKIGSFWGNFGGDFGPFSGRSGVTLESLRDHFGIGLTSFWVVLVSFWPHFEAFLGPFWAIFGPF